MFYSVVAYNVCKNTIVLYKAEDRNIPWLVAKVISYSVMKQPVIVNNVEPIGIAVILL